MKRYFIIYVLNLVALSCTRDMASIHLPEPIPATKIDITKEDTQTPNVFVFNSNVDQAELMWDLGNGEKYSGPEVIGTYPFKGDYTVTLTVLSKGGITLKTYDLIVEKDNYELVSDPVYDLLSGGVENVSGKTWVLDSLTKGHMGCGPIGSYEAEWWNAPKMDKKDKHIYDDEMTFVLKGAKFIYNNHDKSYVNGAAEALMKSRGATLEAEGNYGPAGGDFVATYTSGTNWSWSMLKEGSKYFIMLPPEQGFIAYFTPEPHKYEILFIDADHMRLRQQIDGITWYFKLIRKGWKYPEEPPANPEAHELSEDFEGSKPTVDFNIGDMGALTKFGYGNPAPVPLNTSPKVFLYQKSGAFYSNLYARFIYKFDLTKINKIYIKAYIPSYNDYATEYDVAGPWISNKKLLPQVEVKLQNSDLGGDAYLTQASVVKGNLEMNKWLDLEFDFCSHADRKDFNKIVIQFGGEGHAGSGIFFFDDFKFKE